MPNRAALDNLIEKLDAAGVDAALITSRSNVLYYSGFTGSNGTLFVFGNSRYLLTDFRYIEQGKTESPDFETVDAPTDKLKEFISDKCGLNGIRSIWFEDEHITYKSHKTLEASLEGISLVPASGAVSDLRMVKSASELASMSKAAAVSDSAFLHIAEMLKLKKTEKEIAFELEFYLRKTFGAKPAFDIIVASGPNAALPHAKPTDRVIGQDDHVILDFGAVVDGYRSDMTRTVILGDPGEEIFKIYDIVLQAQKRALEALRPGALGNETDRLSREHISQCGYGQYFGHGLGHGVGLDIHENPRLSEKSSDVMLEGMVVTVEPGIYLPGKGGVRIEDMVVISGSGIKNLTSSPKSLDEIIALCKI